MSNADKKEECLDHCYFFLHDTYHYKQPLTGADYQGCIFSLMLLSQYKIQLDIDSLIKKIKPKPTPSA